MTLPVQLNYFILRDNCFLHSPSSVSGDHPNAEICKPVVKVLHFGRVIPLCDVIQAAQLYDVLPDLVYECLVQIGVGVIDRTFSDRSWYRQYAENVSLFQPGDRLKEAICLLNAQQVLAVRRRSVLPIGKGSWAVKNGRLVTTSFSELPPRTQALFTNNNTASPVSVNETLRCLVNTATSNEDLLTKLKKIDPRMREAEWVPLDSELEKHHEYFTPSDDLSESEIIELAASALTRGIGVNQKRPLLRKFYKADLNEVLLAVEKVIRIYTTKV